MADSVARDRVDSGSYECIEADGTVSGTYTPDESTSKVLGTQDVVKKAKGTGKARDEIPILQGQVESLKREKQDVEESCRTQLAEKEKELQEMRKELFKVKAELEAAKEEIAVKVAQVKQYQKQVEAYKGEVGVLHVKTQEAKKQAEDAQDTVYVELVNLDGAQCQSSSECVPVPTTPPPSAHTSDPDPPADHLSVPPSQVKVPGQPTPSDQGISPGVMGPPPSDAGIRDMKQTPSAKAEMCQRPSCYPSSHVGPGGGSLDHHNESLPPPVVHPLRYLSEGGVHQKESVPPSPGLLAPGHGYTVTSHDSGYPPQHMSRDSGYPPHNMSHDGAYPPHNTSHDRGHPPQHMPHDSGYPPHVMSHDSGYSPSPVSHDRGYQSVPNQAVVADGASRVADAMQRDDDDDDLPPPVYHQPYQQMYRRPVADGVHNGVPLSDQETLQLVGHTNRVPPPSTLGLVQDIGSTDGRGFEETHSPAPLDPNLKCPLCGIVFKKGRIQNYRQHVETCGR